MKNVRPIRLLAYLNVLFAIFAASHTFGQQPAAEIQKLTERLDARRKELGIPGIAFAIVKDGKIITSQGLGYRDLEKNIPVTADTQFGIGSATKAFTAMGILMSRDQGKLSLDDSPKKFLPYFKMNDPDTDKNIQIRDLLMHSSGLNRTDLAMMTGKLNTIELIRVAGEAKPMAKLREKFFYQNLMYAAAGEVIAETQKTPWLKFIPTAIFSPLGMSNSTVSIDQMRKAPDFSFGYQYNFDTKQTQKLPFRTIDPVAAAGSINSSANDMTKWLNYALTNKTAAGNSLLKSDSYSEWMKPQMKIAGNIHYGFGWFIQDWKGLKVVQHGGNIDGFNSLVAMIPEKNLGFVLLTNVSASSLGNELMPWVWEAVLGDSSNAAPAANGDITAFIGKYNFAVANMILEVKTENGRLYAVVPGQPTYELLKIADRKFKLGGAPDGFFMTFKENELFLEQPQGNFTLPRVGTEKTVDTSAARELIGKYKPTGADVIGEISEVSGKISLTIPGQQPYALVKVENDVFALQPLPEAYRLHVKRDANKAVSGIVIKQPEGEFEFTKTGDKTAPVGVSVEKIMSKAIEAIGGEAAIRSVKNRVTEFDLILEQQGLLGSGTSYEAAPNKAANYTKITAFGKTIATIEEIFDGEKGGQAVSFATPELLTGTSLENARRNADFYGIVNWKNGLRSYEVRGVEKVGDEECYQVVFKPEKGTDVRLWFSKTTFLPRKRVTVEVSSTSSQQIPISTELSDYKKIDGVMIPFKTVTSNPSMGSIVQITRSVKQNVKIADKKFSTAKLTRQP